uniref:Ymf60 n=1 Tax=Tetrahymena pigmentosa TaxID=5907 RepID=Q09F24_TETPI|nr:Ymf60 [Tetrahymena pigmentosa]ABI51727.1 Ymf60 [Tetrahymena pigmentosa]
MNNVFFFIPYNINYLLIENKKKSNKFIYLYNDDYYFCIKVNNSIFINKDTNTIKLSDDSFNNKNKLFNNELNKFLFSWDNLFFNKIKFTGKGFKFKKKINNLFLYFNRAHKCFFIGNNIILKRLSKNKVILLKNNYNHLINDSILIRNIRYNNIFTKRGLRFSRQIIYKKKGKTAAQ